MGEYSEAMDRFGIDKPDLRFDMELVDLTHLSKGFNFKIFDEAEIVVGMCCKGWGDLLCIFCGPKLKTQEQMGKFRHLMGTELGLRQGGFVGLWVVNFPMLEWDEDDERFVAKHHPFTSPWTEDLEMMTSLDKKDPRLGD